jgi:hypothetical protein
MKEEMEKMKDHLKGIMGEDVFGTELPEETEEVAQ